MFYNLPEILISLIPAIVFGLMGGFSAFIIFFIVTFIFCKINDKFQII